MSTQSLYYVYALLDSSKPGPFYYGKWKFAFEPFYIGKGKGRRFLAHEKIASRKEEGQYISNSHKSRKIRKLLKQGHEVKIRIIRKQLLEEQAYELEDFLVEEIGRSDLFLGPLVNQADGGVGPRGTVRKRLSKWDKVLHSMSATIQQLSMSEKDRKDISKRISKTLKATIAKIPKAEVDARVSKMLATKAAKPKRVKLETRNKLSASMKRACENKTKCSREASIHNLLKRDWVHDEEKRLARNQKLSEARYRQTASWTPRQRKEILAKQHAGVIAYHANRTPEQIRAASEARKRSWITRRTNTNQ